MKNALDNWHINNISFTDWMQKWGTDTLSENTIQTLQKQYDWCLNNNFNYAPIKLLNEKQIPDEYEIAELEYFINELD